MKKKKIFRFMGWVMFLVFVFLLIGSIVFINQKSFGKVPSKERLLRIEQSPNYKNGTFRNLTQSAGIISDKSRIQIMYEFLVDKVKNLRPTQALPSVKTEIKKLNHQEDLAIWMGHSSIYLQLDGQKLLVDPIFISASPVSFLNKPFVGTSIYSPDDIPALDYLILTHDHWDHLDYHTLKNLKDRIKKIICPLGVGEHLEYWGFDVNKIIELDWNEKAQLTQNIEIYALPARHFSGRGLIPNKSLWASYMIQSSSGNIYLSGDTGYDIHFKQIKEQFGQIDFAFMENGQYNQDWKYIHLMPNDLAQAIKELSPKVLFTIHNSKYALAKHAWYEPMQNISKAAKEYNFPLKTPKIGELIYLNDSTQTFSQWWLEKE